MSAKALSRVLAHAVSPRAAIVEAMTLEMTGGSLQSAEQLMSVCASFGIVDKRLKDQVLALKDGFNARNEIIHEMDMSPGPGRWKRRLRSMRPMIDWSDRALGAAQEIINRVAEALASSAAS